MTKMSDQVIAIISKDLILKTKTDLLNAISFFLLFLLPVNLGPTKS